MSPNRKRHMILLRDVRDIYFTRGNPVWMTLENSVCGPSRSGTLAAGFSCTQSSPAFQNDVGPFDRLRMAS